uniref:Uncharacterized protein n=1 Tax=Pararge aegeria TaxID=116150 RepID=S4PDL5_9NEOP
MSTRYRDGISFLWRELQSESGVNANNSSDHARGSYYNFGALETRTDKLLWDCQQGEPATYVSNHIKGEDLAVNAKISSSVAVGSQLK